MAGELFCENFKNWFVDLHLRVPLLQILAAGAGFQGHFHPPQHPFHASAFCFPLLCADCSTNNPAQANLRQELNDSLQVAERLTQRYNELLHSLQSKMLNTSSLLEQLNDQFNWVSQLANLTQGEDQYYLRVSTVSCVPAI